MAKTYREKPVASSFSLLFDQSMKRFKANVLLKI
jgi:hypothetical protein